MTTAPKLPEGLEPVAWRYKTAHTTHLCHSRLDHYFSNDEGETYIKGEPLVRLSDAQAALQALAADTARLDWIVRQADEFSCSMIVDAPGDGEYIVHGMDGYGQGKTPRDAIDNAMRFNGATSTGRGEWGEGA
jgi:hypothetical protein